MSRVQEKRLGIKFNSQLNYIPYRLKQQLLSPKHTKIYVKRNGQLKFQSPRQTKNQTLSVLIMDSDSFYQNLYQLTDQKQTQHGQNKTSQTKVQNQEDILKIRYKNNNIYIEQQDKQEQSICQTTDRIDYDKIVEVSNQQSQQQFINETYFKQKQQQKTIQSSQTNFIQSKIRFFKSSKALNKLHKFSCQKYQNQTICQNKKHQNVVEKIIHISPTQNITQHKNKKQQRFAQVMKNLKQTNKSSIHSKQAVKKQELKNKLLMRFKKKVQKSQE